MNKQGERLLVKTLSKLDRQSRPNAKKRRKTIAWTIIKYGSGVAVSVFIIYALYIIGYKYNRCQINKEANRLTYQTCVDTLERKDYTAETKQKSYNSLGCPEAVKKTKRSCVWHGFYSLYNKMYEGIVYLSTSFVVWITLAVATFDRIYRWKNVAENIIYANDDDYDDDDASAGLDN